MRLPSGGVAAIGDVRKVTSSPSSPITVAANVSPMPDEEINRLAAAFASDVRSRVLGTLGGNETVEREVTVNPATSAASQSHRITQYLQSLGATDINVSGLLAPIITVSGLSNQDFETARRHLPVGVQLRAAGGPMGRVDVAAPTAAEAQRRLAADVRRSSNIPPPAPLPPQPSSPSRFSLLEVDADIKAPAPQAPKASTGLAALQQELRAEREAKRARAAAQTPQGRFDLLECDLPAVPAVAVKASLKRPVVSPPPPKPLNPVETITDLTAARSPLELARMLAGLDEELSMMLRQREAN
jgi:hypothetical protein